MNDDDDDPYELVRVNVRDSITECDRFTEMLAGELKALKPLPQRTRSPELPPDDSALSPDARAAKTMLALGNMRLGRPANAFYAEALYYLDRAVRCPHCGAAKTVAADQPAEPSALDRAKAAIRAAPEQSNRSIAKEIGTTEITVRRARKDVAPDDAPDHRIGRDGKHYPAEPEMLKGSKPLPGGLLDPAYFEEVPLNQYGSEEEPRWRGSICNMTSMISSLPAYWKREFPKHESYKVTPLMEKLVCEADVAWEQFKRDLAKHRR